MEKGFEIPLLITLWAFRSSPCLIKKMRAATLLNLIYLYKKASSLFGLSAPLLSVFSLRTSKKAVSHFLATQGRRQKKGEIC